MDASFGAGIHPVAMACRGLENAFASIRQGIDVGQPLGQAVFNDMLRLIGIGVLGDRADKRDGADLLRVGRISPLVS